VSRPTQSSTQTSTTLKLITGEEIATDTTKEVYPHFWINFDKTSFEAWKKIVIDYLRLVKRDVIVNNEIRLPRGKLSEVNRKMLILVEKNLAQLAHKE